MKKNYVLFIVSSVVAVIFCYFFIPNTQTYINKNSIEYKQNSDIGYVDTSNNKKIEHINNDYDVKLKHDDEIIVESDMYKAVFTKKGASITKWSIKEKNGYWTNLILSKSLPFMSIFDEKEYKIVNLSKNLISFEYESNNGWKIKKTYNLSNGYMHNLNIIVEKNIDTVVPQIKLNFGSALSNYNSVEEKSSYTTKIIGYDIEKTNKIKKFKNYSDFASFYKWVAIDSRYFLAAIIFEQPEDFYKIELFRENKKLPQYANLTILVPNNIIKKEYSINFYLGPKDYFHLKSYNLALEKSIDFGYLGFFGKFILTTLIFFNKTICNYGWSIIIITIIIQILVLPLTLKSSKSISDMKRIQPIIKSVQEKYKNDSKRLQIELLNIYRSQKVNPLGGCLPMILQLPIFWAFFTMLRNSYEIRNEGWILWIKDLSSPDRFMHLGFFDFNLLPLLMGIGMFFQQKMTTSVISDATQKKMLYIMPIIFTVMFWSFPSGLIIYWTINNIFTICEQYFVFKKESIKLKKI
jgi:YidC/Oxa1 family membrane protein insertase